MLKTVIRFFKRVLVRKKQEPEAKTIKEMIDEINSWPTEIRKQALSNFLDNLKLRDETKHSLAKAYLRRLRRS